MNSINFVSDNTLRILYGDNRFPISPIDIGGADLPYTDWCGNLLDPFRRDWQSVPVILFGTSGGSSNVPDLYKFSYDSTRYNPYKISQNFNKALQLLDECYALKDRYQELEVQILDQESMFNMSEDLFIIDEAELPIIEQKLSSIANSNEILKSEDGQSFRTNSANIILGDRDSLEIEIRKKRKALQKMEVERLKNESRSANSPYNKNRACSRFKAKYAHRLTELTMLIECLKHGRLILFGEIPSSLKVDQDTLYNAIDEYRNFPDSIMDLSNALRRKSENKDEDIERSAIENETPIREFLWDISRKLQQENISSETYIQRISIKSSMSIAGQTWENNLVTRRMIFEFEDFGIPRRTRLLGVTAEAILKDDKTYVQMLADKVYDVRFQKESLKDTIFRFSVKPPTQYLGNSDQYPSKDVDNVIFCSTPAMANQTSAMNSVGGPIFFGKNTLENFTPFGIWWLDFQTTPSMSEIKNQIKDFYLYLHLKS